MSSTQQNYPQKYGNCLAVLGLQWGDEGKGKLVDILAQQYDIIVRANGGANAGHTINFEVDGQKKKIVFHLLPSGMLHKDKICVIGNGCVVDMVAVKQEIDDLMGNGIDLTGRFFISDRAQIVFGYHKVIDGKHEELKGKGKVGTTMRGIGPAYADKINRINLRVADMIDFDSFKEKYRAALNLHKKLYGIDDYDAEGEIARYQELAEFFKDKIKNTSYYLNNALDEGKTVLLEGANGSLLDIDHGTYPFVTSSNTTLGGICAGSGIAPKRITHTIGILKAYTTRVGEGPFPTEQDNEIGKKLQDIGGEYGATTGRGRRCGWFDTVAARYTCMLNGVDSLNLTKVDVLNDFEELKICTEYELDGAKTDEFPTSIAALENTNPIYEDIAGWHADIKEPLQGASKTPSTKAETDNDQQKPSNPHIDTTYSDLPQNCQKYIEKIEHITGAKVEFIGTGPSRSQMIVR